MYQMNHPSPMALSRVRPRQELGGERASLLSFAGLSVLKLGMEVHLALATGKLHYGYGEAVANQATMVYSRVLEDLRIRGRRWS